MEGGHVIAVGKQLPNILQNGSPIFAVIFY